MQNVLLILNIILSIALVVLILIQGKGSGLGSAWGGGGAYTTRRGVEKVTLQATYVLVILFFLVSVANFFIQ
ncbi:MAG: preprotein translocase subunit SecG [bacterium]|nr:preprotein translocase subunit SecG [bacterium]